MRQADRSPSVRRLRMKRAIPPFTLYSFMAFRETTFPFLIFYIFRFRFILFIGSACKMLGHIPPSVPSTVSLLEINAIYTIPSVESRGPLPATSRATHKTWFPGGHELWLLPPSHSGVATLWVRVIVQTRRTVKPYDMEDV